MAEEKNLEKDWAPSPQEFQLEMIKKLADDSLWYQRLGGKAEVDISRITGNPPANTLAQSDLDKGNPVIFTVYTFVPRTLDKKKKGKAPSMLLIHGGIHNNFSSSAFAHIVEELVDRGITVIAPDYRGSTGYGALTYKLIDYGGEEVEDVLAARDWALASFPFLDPKRTGIMGWSHGGMITLLSIFRHPGVYKAAFAGVPVSDIITRLGYHQAKYNNMYAADYHMGKYPWEDLQEYLRRSPAWNVDKFDDSTPLLVHTNTTDEDVNVIEVKQLIRALKAENKKFEYEIFEAVPGGHMFDRIDTIEGRAIRNKIWDFFEKNL